MPNIELTDQEFDLVCMAVDVAAENLKEASDNDLHEEDIMIDNKYYIKYRELQKIFPSPGPVGLGDIT